jgi:dynein heavy chain
MLPSPSKFHYVFSLRELSRVFEGILRVEPDELNTGSEFAHFWRHECLRAFMDKLSSLKDKEAFMSQLDDFTYVLMAPQPQSPSPTPVDDQPSVAVGGRRGSSKTTTTPPPTYQRTVKNPAIAVIKEGYKHFVNFLREDEYDDEGELIQEAPLIYEEGGSLESLKEKVIEYLDKYNTIHVNNKLSIVLFDDAMKHLISISRVLGMPKGNLLLVGVGGSGKQSLTRLASYIAKHHIFQITLVKGYNINSFKDDFKELYKMTGPLRKKTTFIISDNEIIDEIFLEIINSFLTTGEIPKLFSKDELGAMASDLRPFAIKERSDFVDKHSFLLKYFIEQVRSNLHLVLCMSPVGD